MKTIRDYEKKITSQNGEDGIIEHLPQYVRRPDKSFIEIGCSDGYENNSRNLLAMGMHGVCVDSSWQKLLKYRNLAKQFVSSQKIQLKCMRITLRNCSEALKWLGLSPDLFSLDIDSYDYYVADSLLRSGFRPSVVCVEANTFLGEQPLTVEYQENFSRYTFDPDKGLYFGASPDAWRLS